MHLLGSLPIPNYSVPHPERLLRIALLNLADVGPAAGLGLTGAMSRPSVQLARGACCVVAQQ